MTRKNDVFGKITYASQRFDELVDEIFNEGFGGSNISHLENKANDILSNLREVFDYCAKDIAEKYVQPHDQILYSKFQKRLYFPFYKSQIVKGQWFHLVKLQNRDIYDYISDIADNIETGNLIPETNIKYSVFSDLSNTVNNKKHDSLATLKTVEGETVYASDGPAKLSFNLSVGDNKTTFLGANFANQVAGKSYYFAHNNREVPKFLMECNTATKITMENLYDLI